MHASLLRELIRLALLESKDEDQLKKWFVSPEHEDSAEDMLMRHGLTPVQRVNNKHKLSSFLGSGVYSMTYEVIFEGTHAVAKITDSVKDIEMLEELDKLRKQLPPEVARHILNVYDTFYVDEPVSEYVSSIDDDSSLRGNYTPSNPMSRGSSSERRREREPEFYVAVVEYLVPMPKSLEREYWGAYNDADEAHKDKVVRAKNFFANPDSVANVLVDVVKNDRTMSKFIITGKALQQIKKTVSEDEGLFSKLFNEKSGLVKLSQLELYLAKLFKDVNRGGKMLKNEPHKEAVNNVARRLMHAIEKLITGDRFPIHHGDLVPKSILKNVDADKRIVSLLKALEHLKREFNIEWFDLHQGNIMVRPSTGELVISDPGLFE